jgi:plastocyanin
MCSNMQRMILLTATTAGACACCSGCGPIPGSDPRGSTTLTREPTMAGQLEPAPQTREISIDNFTFTPARLTIPAGSKVVWVNHDDVPHTVVSDSRAFKSPALDTDDHFEHTFTTPGTYAYFCSIHPHMTAEIIVTSPN